jgi:ATP-dependent Lon protease
MVVPLFIRRDHAVAAIRAVGDELRVALVAQKDPLANDPDPDSLFQVGTLGSVMQVLTLPDGTIKALVQGKERIKIKKFSKADGYIQADIAPFEEDSNFKETEAEPLRRALLSEFEAYMKLSRKDPTDVLASIEKVDDFSKFTDLVAGHVPLRNMGLKQNLLEEVSVLKRMELLLEYIDSELTMFQAEKRIKNRIKNQIEQNYRQYVLNEQMRAIQRELDDSEDGRSEVQELEAKIKKAKLSKEAGVKALAELKKLKNMNPMSAEATVVRGYLDVLLDLPWGRFTKTRRSLDQAETILNKDHYGLPKIKEKILDYLAVSSRVDRVKGPILCLVGPPGVGKTSLGRSVAEATGRQFVRVAVGGVDKESEIRGHRRTYVGSMPGKIIQALKKAKSSNPLILLDEIDKLGTSWSSDPVSALLEVLDPEQNEQFQDHYLEIGFDLSRVMFVATANSMNMHPALLDRMEVVRLAGYTEDEKVNIAKKHLLPRQLKGSGLKTKEFGVSDNALRRLIRRYCKEAGVRNLERLIASLARKTVRLIDTKKLQKLLVTPQNLQKYAGIPRFHEDDISFTDAVGVTKGLAWTEVGGELLNIEAVMLPGKGKMTTTGKLGEVMQESIQAASSFVRSKAVDYGVKPSLFERRDIHVHVPEGATPKDGPSAGVAMCTAIVSVLTGVPVKGDVAMTGEISLRGRVLPIGGVREKLLAAHRAGIQTVLIPKDNQKDLEEIPANVKRGLNIRLMETVDDVLACVLTKTLKPTTWTHEDQRLFDEARFGLPSGVKLPSQTGQSPHTPPSSV